MALKLAVTVLVICFATVQEMKGLALNPDSSSCNLQIQPLRSEITLAAKQASFAISSAASTINRNIALIRTNIKTEINKVQLKANQALGPNANLCKKNLNLELAQLNNQALNLCYKNAELNSLNQKVNQINSLKGVASQICSICALETSCVDAKIEEVRKQAQDLQAEISAEALAVQEQSSECATGVENSQLEIINNASANFDACIQNA